MANLGFQHTRHQVRHRPHTFTDLGNTSETGFQPDVHVPLLVGLNPGSLLHRPLADKRPQLHGRVDFVTSAVKEAGIDEYGTLPGGMDTGLEVNGGAPLFVHDANFQGEGRQTKRIFNTTEELIGKRHFFRTVHLRLNNVNRAGGAVLQLSSALEVVNRDQ